MSFCASLIWLWRSIRERKSILSWTISAFTNSKTIIPGGRNTPSVHFHFTPIHASWLNQIEAWFSILSRSALKGASFRNVRSLIEAIERFIAVHNQEAMPFVWTKIRVNQKTPESKYADLSFLPLVPFGPDLNGKSVLRGQKHRVNLPNRIGVADCRMAVAV